MNVGAGNDSPVVTMAPIIAMQQNLGAATFQVPATDPDGDALTYRLATSSEISGGQPSGISINSTTGVLTFNTNGKSVGQLYNAAIVVEDGQSKVINDFIIKIVKQSNPPEFDYSVTPSAGYVYQTSPGQTVTFNVKALDTDPGSTVQLSAIGAPLGSSFSPSLPTTANPVQTTFSWTPTASNLGTNVINFIVQDNVGSQVNTAVSIIVSLKPATYIGGVNISCNGLTDGSIDATMDGGCLPYTFAWSDGQTVEDAANLGAGTYTLTVTDAKGRTISETVTLTEPDVLATSLVMSPDFPVAGQNQYTIYLGYGTQTVNLASTTTGGILGYTYAWTDQDGVNVGNTASIDVSPMVPTNYTLLVTDANGCTVTASFFVDVIDARCGNNMNKVMLCHKESKTKKGVTTVEYHNICVSANAVAAHLAHGDYLGPCINGKMDAVDVVEEEGIVLFPNPNNGMFSVFFTGEHHDDGATISVYAVDGRLIYTRTVNAEDMEQDIEFDISNNSAGMYLLVVQQGDQVRTIKFSKN